jgi:hypothetical protein
VPDRHSAHVQHPRIAKAKAEKKVKSQQREEKPVATVAPRWTSRAPDALARSTAMLGQVAALAPAQTGPAEHQGSVLDMRSLLWFAVAIGVLVAAAAATRRSPVLREVLGLAYDHRDALVLGGLTTAFAIGIGVVIAVLGS